jgi:hypothetical protein
MENKDIYIDKAAKWSPKNPQKAKKIKLNKANKIPQYSEVKGLLTLTEKPTSDENGLLKVVCAYCDRYFYPKYSAIRSRIKSLEKVKGGELRLYCSDGCKKACSIYGRVLWAKGDRPATSREVQPALLKMRLKHDNYECQRCGKSTHDNVELHCHHITGVEQNQLSLPT